MKRLFSVMSFRWQRLFEFADRAALTVVILASAPFVPDLVGRGVGWITGLFPHQGELWKECRWCF